MIVIIDGEQNNVHSPILKEAFPLPTAQALHVPMSQLQDRHQPVLEPVSSPATSSTFKLTIDMAKPFVAPVQPLRCVGSGSIQATNPCPVALQRRPYHRYSQAGSCSKAWRSETSKTRFRHHAIICTSGFEIETGKKKNSFRQKKTSSKPIFGVFDFSQTVFRAASLGDPGTLGPCLSVRKLLSTHHNSPRSEPQILSPLKNPAW